MNGKLRAIYENNDGFIIKPILRKPRCFFEITERRLFCIKIFNLKEEKTFMTAFLRRAIIEYKRKTEMKKNFIEHNRKRRNTSI